MVKNSLGQEPKEVLELKKEIRSSPDTFAILKMLELAEEYKKFNLDSMIEYAKKGQELSKLKGYKRGLFLSLKSKASYFYNIGDYLKAEIEALKALELTDKYGNQSEISNIQNLLGLVMMSLGEYFEAETMFKKSLAIYQKMEDQNGLAKVLHNLGVISFYQNNYELSTRYYLDALHATEKAGDSSLLAQVNTNLGLLFSTQKDFKRAIIYLRKSLAIYDELHNPRGRSKTFSGLGTAYFNFGKIDSSLINHQKALSLYRELGNFSGEAEALNNIGEIYIENLAFETALDYISKSDSIRVNTGDVYGHAICAHNFGRIYEELKRKVEAEDNYTEAIEKAKALNANWLLMQFYSSRASYYEINRDYRAALSDWKAKTALSDTLFNNDKTQIINELEKRYQAEKKDVELKLKANEIENLEKEGEIFKLIVFSGGVILLLIGFLAYLFYSKEKIKQADKLELASKNLEISRKSKELEESLRKAAEQSLQIAGNNQEQMRSELEFKKRELTQLALYINQQNESLENIKNELSSIKPGDNRKLERQLEQQLNISKQREDFEMNVDLMNEDFYHRLSTKFPNLTDNDKKLCAMIRLGLSSKEIASIISISPKSVDMNRYRLRKKLALNSETDLATFVAGL